jgi:acetyltransferase-like isoleucine patch superfamily enzyme
MKRKVKVGDGLRSNKIKRAIINLLGLFAWFAPWKGFRMMFHKLRGTKIGKGAEIGYMVFIDNRRPELVNIEENATITSMCNILAHDLSMRYIDGTEIIGNTIIKAGAFVGMNSTIMPGVTIGKNCIIACGSVVTKDTEPNSVYGGVPAKLLKKIDGNLH